jgi:hypothetical protein
MLLAAVCWRCRFRFDTARCFAPLPAVEEHVHTFLSLRLTGRYRREDWICYIYVERVLAKMLVLEHRSKECTPSLKG